MVRQSDNHGSSQNTGRRVNLSEALSARGSWSIIFIYNAITALIIAAFYPVIPLLLNYPPNVEEVSTKLGTSTFAQYVVIAVIALILGTIILLWFFRGINRWTKLDVKAPANRSVIDRIRSQCINLPNSIFLLQILIMTIPLALLMFAVATMNRITYLAPAKVVLMVTSFFSLAAVISQTFSREIFKRILIKTFDGQGQEGKRVGLQRKIFLQVLPIILITVLFMGLIGYSRLIEEKGNLMYSIFRNQLQDRAATFQSIGSVQDAFERLNGVGLAGVDCFYVVKPPESPAQTSDGSFLGGYLTYFIDNPYGGDRLYDINAEVQGVITEVHTDRGVWKMGVIFHVDTETTILFFGVGLSILLVLNGFVLYYFSKSMSDDISLVAEKLTEIAESDEVDLDRKIPVTSNDEMADLVVAFNRILDREKQWRQETEENHEIMMEQERMASLGHLMGGVAHNLRTPIMSLSGAIEGMRDLVQEYESSYENPEITGEDHREIAREMMVWTDKMKSHCSYMSDIITAIRGQTQQPSDEKYLQFTLETLWRRIHVLLTHELKMHHCILNTDFQADPTIAVQGDLSALVQIINNLILNAADAYDGNGGVIEITTSVEGNNVIIAVKDHGKGIPEAVQAKLFKEMITTKGKKGTGLGLYTSASSLKARFGGKMRFESHEGVGTTFYVSVPVRTGKL